ncbi:nucleotidyltransferase [Catellatospora sp. NPDC049609]|uniref:nucleotidyltransferase n=1 Tax=Catellatospora sp. NPDC049609 TaxID=3155505 RepID=UPI00341682DE
MAPRSTAESFDEFDASLNLDPLEREQAQRRHQEITEVLTVVGIAKSTFLQGSFARKTMPKPLKDVDMVVLLAEVYRAPWFGPGRGGPAAAMAEIRAAVASRWPNARFDAEKQSPHALQVTFSDCTFTVDLVPAFDDPEGSEDVFIADRDLDRWEWSNTRTLRRVVTERNLETLGAFVHQVRMGKAFKSHEPVLEKLCGLAVESLWYAAIKKKMPHATAMVTAFEYAAVAVQGKVLDPTGVDDLAKDWTPGERHMFSQAFALAAKRGREALRLAADGEHQGAIEIWFALFGEPFPAPSTQTAAQALSALSAGSITSTGRAVASQRGAQVNRPARSWRTR